MLSASRGGCRPTDGVLNPPGPDGTTTFWTPTCFGVFLSSDPTQFTVYATRGTALDKENRPQSTEATGALVQSRANGAINRQVNAQFINFDVVGGTSSARGDTDNSVGQLISVLQRPGRAGERPPSTWGQNIDLHINPGSGNTLSMIQELDLNNFNRNCGIATGCNSWWIWFNGISRYSNLAMLYGGGATTEGFSGTVTTKGKVATLASGKFRDDIAFLTVAGTSYRADYVDAKHLETDVDLPPNGNAVPFQAHIAQAHYGWFLNGLEQVKNADLRFDDAAAIGMQLSGKHNTAIDTSKDAALFSLKSAASQQLCFDTSNRCFYYGKSGYLGYLVNGVTPFAVGDGGDVHGSIAVFSSFRGTLRTPSSSRAPCAPGDFSDDARFHYVCVAPNHWRRVALSEF